MSYREGQEWIEHQGADIATPVMTTPSQSPSTASLRSSADNTPRQRNGALLSIDQYSSSVLSNSNSNSSCGHINNNYNVRNFYNTNNNNSRQQQLVSNAKAKKGCMASLPLPKPLEPSKCPLFCCFYAEFDNKVGPTICFQSPQNFMNQAIGMPLEQIHDILNETFDNLCHNNNNNNKDGAFPEGDQQGNSKNNSSHQDKETETQQFSSSSSSSPPSSSQPAAAAASVSSPLESPTLSIFDSCSEYIITGNELTGNVINLSTHELHLLTRPTIIHDKAYERNSFLFSVGFVLRRSSDPRPFQPIISKWARTLHEMELESQYLSNSATRGNLQALTEQLLVSLNSRSRECNLYISPAYVLHLKLFHPPRVPAYPVPDYVVPTLLLRDWRQCQAYYDWDLSIDWCARHIDGLRNARQISEKAEVDMEIVRSCLRVLKHHGVIGLCGMFFYSNRYEATERAFALFAGREPSLLLAATEHAIKSLEGAVSTPPYDGSPSLQAMPLSPATEGSGSSRAADRHGPFQAASSRFVGLPATPSSDVHFTMSYRREDIHDLKLAVAEFYSRCGRNTSFGDTWISLVRSSNTTSSSSSSSIIRRPGCGQDMTVDWKRAFELLDHRRLVAFGVIHGLIRRVHRFPRFMPTAENMAALRALEFAAKPPKITSPVHGSLSHHASALALDRETISRHLQRHSSNSGAILGGNGGVMNKGPKLTPANIAASMDGWHCDDELACEFERSLDELLTMIPGRVSIVLALVTY